jgi:HSP20 family protein
MKRAPEQRVFHERSAPRLVWNNRPPVPACREFVAKMEDTMARNPLSPFQPGGLAERGLGEDPFMSLHREMNRLFDDVFRGVPMAGRRGSSGGEFVAAHMDVSETENQIRICAELPGVSQDDVEVTLDDDVLTIKGEKKLERKDEKENYHFMERSYGTFQRSLRLPFRVEPDQVQADFNNGVLTVTLPKTKAQDRSRRIQVQASGASRLEAQKGQQTATEQSNKGGKGGKAL